jgi:hypothetical protein
MAGREYAEDAALIAWAVTVRDRPLAHGYSRRQMP